MHHQAGRRPDHLKRVRHRPRTLLAFGGGPIRVPAARASSAAAAAALRCGVRGALGVNEPLSARVAQQRRRKWSESFRRPTPSQVPCLVTSFHCSATLKLFLSRFLAQLLFYFFSWGYE